jgi:hypothetical protein
MKPCANNCGKPAGRQHKYCGRACYMAAEQAKGPARFWAKVDKGPNPGGCWLYMGFRKWDGYGWLARWHNGKPRSLTAHRYAWILTHGEPPEGAHILHQCDNPPCCNPSHLRLGTHQENMADQRSKGRHVHGERSRRNRLTFQQAQEVKRRFRFYTPRKTNARELAAEYGVTPQVIYLAGTGRTWKIDAPSPRLHPDRVRPRRQA